MRSLIVLLTVMFSWSGFSIGTELSYSGRLVQTSGAPVAGPVNMTFEVILDDGSSPSTSWPVICTVTQSSVALSNGVFNVSLDFATGTPCTPYSNINDVFVYANSNNFPIYFRTTDTTNSKVYPLQPVKPIPIASFALAGGTPGGYDLDTDTKYNACTAGQALVRNGADTAFECATVGGTVSITTGTGLTGGPVGATGTISIATGGVDTTQIADDAVTSAKLAADAVDNTAMANNAVNTAEIADDAVTSAKLAADAVDNTAMANNAVNTAEIADDAVTSAKLAADAVDNTAMANNAVNTAEIVDDAVTSAKLAASAVDATAIAANAVTNAKVNDVDYGKITESDCSDGQVLAASSGNFVCTNASAVGNWTLSSGDIYYNSGNVGVGTTSPVSTFEVDGQARNSSSISNAGTSIDFSTGNLQYTSASCGAFTLNNLKDGGSYTLAVKGATSATCSFTTYSGSGTTGPLTVHLPTNHRATTVSTHTLYTFIVMGTDLYVAFVPGL